MGQSEPPQPTPEAAPRAGEQETEQTLRLERDEARGLSDTAHERLERLCEWKLKAEATTARLREALTKLGDQLRECAEEFEPWATNENNAGRHGNAASLRVVRDRLTRWSDEAALAASPASSKEE